MLYTIPTKKGLGVELWGTYEDLENFYSVINKFWNGTITEESKNRDNLISSFSYEIRKAMEGSRSKRKSSHFTPEDIAYFGTKISWVHFLFSLTEIKFCMRQVETNKYDISIILLIEYWLEKSMIEFDLIGAKKLVGFIEDGLFPGNKNSYLFMRSINLDYFMLNGGKTAFRKLPSLLRKGVFLTDEYNGFQAFLEKEAKRWDCAISDLDIADDDFDYNTLKW